MNRELHKVLFELDNKFDIEVEDYFSLNNEDKAELTKYIVDYFIPELNRNPLFISTLNRAFTIMLEEAEAIQEYEKCDIYIRVLALLKGYDFFRI